MPASRPVSRTTAVDPHLPLADLNITPLIDVLLVLIVMFILCLPAMTNELPIDLPGKAVPASDAPVHRLSLDSGGAMRWDGAPIGDGALDQRLRETVAGGAQLTLASDARTRFEAVDRTLATVKRAGVTRLGFEGNERFAAF